MIGATDFAPSSSSTVANRSTVALQAQLARYQTELAQWLSCPWCKTPEGKAKIAELTTRIGEIEQRMAAADSAGRGRQVEGSDGAARANGVSGIGETTVTSALPNDGPLGRHLDVYA